MVISETDNVNSKQDEQNSQTHIEGSSRRLAQDSINNLVGHRFDASSVCTFGSFVTEFGASFSVEMIF